MVKGGAINNYLQGSQYLHHEWLDRVSLLTINKKRICYVS